ncbi:hypothetical protein ACMGDM_05725 [Sphingomonas sp. DT-51]
MSEPFSAFLQLRCSRAALTRWLDAAPTYASRWRDWRDIGGRWSLRDGESLDHATDATLVGLVHDADALIGRFADNRAFVRRLLWHPCGMTEFQLASFDSDETFVAGCVEYSESLVDILAFHAIVRGAADHLGQSGSGAALVHNFVWGMFHEAPTAGAARLTPADPNYLVPAPEREAIVALFQPIVDALLEQRVPDGFTTLVAPGLLAA